MAAQSIGRTFLALSALLTVALMTSTTDAAGPGSLNGTVQASPPRQDADGITLRLPGVGVLRLQVWSDSIIRITSAPGDDIPTLKSLAIVAKPSPGKFNLLESPEALTVQTAALRVRIDRKSAAITFLDLKENILLQETPDGREVAPILPPTPNTPAATQPFLEGTLVRQSFILPPDEGLYGLGQHQQGLWNYRASGGHAIRLLQQNTEVGIPVLLSSKGYGIFWDNPAVTEISIGAPLAAAGARGRGVPGAGEDILRWYSEVGKAIDYYFMAGSPPTPADDVIRDYRHLTGQAPMLPRWAWGFLHSKERYRSQTELLDVAREFRKNNIPIDTLIQDWRYWPDNTWGSHAFDPTRYPDPAAMFKELHTLNYHALISVWPKFDLGTANIAELEKVGGMYEPIIPYVYPPGRGKWYDPMTKAGRDTYWKQLATELLPLGVDGWWLDAPEPELSGKWGEYRFFKTALGPGAEVFNAYPLMHSTGIYEGQRATTSDQKRVIILTRSAYAGQQRNSAITWSGDIAATWQVFRNQIPAGLNFSISGIPYWNTDTGGFFNNAATGNQLPSDPRYQELFTRWFQFSAFCPMFRVHGTGQNSGTGIGKEIYRFPEDVQKRLLTSLNLRYRLLPYIYSTAWQVTNNGYTMMRPLFMDFPDDPQVRDIGNQYLFGPSIMVSPVTTQGATTRTIHLPGKGTWYDFWTGKKDMGGKEIEAPAPIDATPLFIRAGSILPLGPLLQYTSEKPADPLELRIYRGADGQFTLYEDEGDSYNYEKGTYATIPITWNETNQTLTLGDRKGEFPNMLKERTFNIVFVKDDHGQGAAITEHPDQTVKYTGQSVTVKAAQ